MSSATQNFSSSSIEDQNENAEKNQYHHPFNYTNNTQPTEANNRILNPLEEARQRVERRDFIVTHEDIQYQFHWNTFFLKLGQVHQNIPLIINLVARGVDISDQHAWGTANEMTAHWDQPVDRTPWEIDQALTHIMRYLVDGAGLAFLNGPEGLFMDQVEKDCVWTALSESQDCSDGHLLQLGIDIVERRYPEGWDLQRIEADRTVHTIWVEEIGLDPYQMAV